MVGFAIGFGEHKLSLAEMEELGGDFVWELLEIVQGNRVNSWEWCEILRRDSICKTLIGWSMEMRGEE